MEIGIYFQAQMVERECWFLVAILRSFEHLVFDRTLDKHTSTFEFFVPENNEKTFVELLDYLKQQGVVIAYQKLPNRLLDPSQKV